MVPNKSEHCFHHKLSWNDVAWKRWYCWKDNDSMLPFDDIHAIHVLVQGCHSSILMVYQVPDTNVGDQVLDK